MTEEEGLHLASFAGERVHLTIDATRTPATGWNPLASTGNPAGKEIVVFAHIDSKIGTPGAVDNAAGVVTLLLIAELLAGKVHNLDVQMVALNGEDHYSAIGEMVWLRNRDGYSRTLLGINIDDAGYYKGETAWSLYGCPEALNQQITGILSTRSGLVMGESWYQSDHSLFIQNGVPALAFTTTELEEILGEIAHTEKDTFAIVDARKLVEVARAVQALILDLDASQPT
jgi:aminopeptidase YwaD